MSHDMSHDILTQHSCSNTGMHQAGLTVMECIRQSEPCEALAAEQVAETGLQDRSARLFHQSGTFTQEETESAVLGGCCTSIYRQIQVKTIVGYPRECGKKCVVYNA
eukprot:scpid84199/ scgid14990/ 